MNIELKNMNRGATMIEYSLISALVAVVAIASMNNLGRVVTSKMESVSTSLESKSTEVEGGGDSNDDVYGGICPCGDPSCNMDCPEGEAPGGGIGRLPPDWRE